MIPVRDTTIARGFAPVTTVLIAAILAMFIQELRLGEQVFHLFRASPADIAGYLIDGKHGFLRIHVSIIASGFIHTGYVHLVGNLIFLSVFAPLWKRAWASSASGSSTLLPSSRHSMHIP